MLLGSQSTGILGAEPRNTEELIPSRDNDVFSVSLKLDSQYQQRCTDMGCFGTIQDGRQTCFECPISWEHGALSQHGIRGLLKVVSFRGHCWGLCVYTHVNIHLSLYLYIHMYMYYTYVYMYLFPTPTTICSVRRWGTGLRTTPMPPAFRLRVPEALSTKPEAQMNTSPKAQNCQKPYMIWLLGPKPLYYMALAFGPNNHKI